jgi:hypothetical protein
VGSDPLEPVELGTPAWVGLQLHVAPDPAEGLVAALRLWVAGPGPDPPVGATAGVLLRRLRAAGLAPEVGIARWARAFEREWARGAWRRLRPARRAPVGVAGAVRLALAGGLPVPPAPVGSTAHAVLFGASGSGKSTALVHLARARLARGEPFVLLDVHGDLCARVVAGASVEEAARVRAIDPTRPGPVCGVRMLGVEGAPAEAERAHLLAALRRLGSDEGGLYWGFRMDRVFDGFAQLAQEEGGDLRDLFEMLVDPARRALARARTRRPELARFLDELAPIVRRNPEFLWPAAARLHRVLHSPALAGLIAPAGPGLPVEEALEEGGALLVRIPVALLGPEGAAFAATLLTTRLYLARVARAILPGASAGRVSFLLDEAHLLAPRLLAEMLAEGRKFGVEVVAATQYPGRLAPEVREAVEGAVHRHLLFRVPRVHAAMLGRFVGLAPAEAERSLPALPSGFALQLEGGPQGRRERVTFPPPPPEDPAAWAGCVRASQARYAPAGPEPSALPEEVERLGLALVASEEERSAPTPAELLRRDPALPGPERLEALIRAGRLNGELAVSEGRLRLTARGRYRLGFTPHTGASRESELHRALILEAYRLFARHGHRLEILRQDRFDAARPDARLLLLSPTSRAGPPGTLERELARVRGSWAWRLSGGRDVHVEAEVSGAERPERIRHDLAKGARADAFVLFVVPDPARARRVRSVLSAARVPRDRAAVWTLARARSGMRAPGEVPGGTPEPSCASAS